MLFTPAVIYPFSDSKWAGCAAVLKQNSNPHKNCICFINFLLRDIRFNLYAKYPAREKETRYKDLYPEVLKRVELPLRDGNFRRTTRIPDN